MWCLAVQYFCHLPSLINVCMLKLYYNKKRISIWMKPLHCKICSSLVQVVGHRSSVCPVCSKSVLKIFQQVLCVVILTSFHLHTLDQFICIFVCKSLTLTFCLFCSSVMHRKYDASWIYSILDSWVMGTFELFELV